MAKAYFLWGDISLHYPLIMIEQSKTGISAAAALTKTAGIKNQSKSQVDRGLAFRSVRGCDYYGVVIVQAEVFVCRFNQAKDLAVKSI